MEKCALLTSAEFPGTSADFGKLINMETEKWGKVVKSAGITAN
jgi:hypothetical protein